MTFVFALLHDPQLVDINTAVNRLRNNNNNNNTP